MITQPIYRRAFRYYDETAPGYQYYTILGGAVDINLGYLPLNHSPEGWKDYEIAWERAYTYFGMFTAHSTQMKWHGDEARILRHIFLTQGIQGKCELFVEKFNTDQSVWAYETFFVADFDFNTYVSEFDYVAINVLEGGFPSKLWAREDTEFEIDLATHPDVKYIRNDGLELQALVKWVGSAGAVLGGYYNPALTWVGTEGTNLVLNPINQNVAGGGAVRFVENKSGASQDVELRYNYNIELTLDAGIAHDCYFWIQLREIEISTNTLISTTYILNSTYSHAPGTTHVYSGDISQINTFDTDRRFEVVYRVWDYVAAAFILATEYDLTSHKEDVSIYLVNRFNATYHPALSVMTVFEELVSQINDNATTLPTVSSDLFETTYTDQFYLTSGDGVRNFEGAKLKISWRDFFQFIRVNFGAAFYYSFTANECYLNTMNYVFDNAAHSVIPDIGEVKTCKVMPFSSETFTNLNIGCGSYVYDKQTEDDIEVTNGKDEANLTASYLSPITKLKKDANYETKVRTDPHGLEWVRINFTGKLLADVSTDNDVFAIHANAAVDGTFTLPDLTTADYRDLYRKAISTTPGASYFTIENIFSPSTIYNIFFWPVYDIFRNGTWFRSLFKFNDSEYLKLQVTNKNNSTALKMVISEGVGPVITDGNDDILISSLCDDGRELFWPVYLEVETLEVIDLYTLIGTDKYRYVTFTYLGNSYKGFIKSVTSKPATRNTAKFVLLPTIDNDLTDLER